MTVRHHDTAFRRLGDKELEAWANADPAGISVCPGDLVIAAADGVIIASLKRTPATLRAFANLKRRESEALAALNEGGSLADIYGIPKVMRV